MFREMITALMASGIVGGVAIWYFNRVNNKVDEQGKEITSLKDDKIKVIEKDLKDHITNDKTDTVISDLKHITKSVDKLTLTTERLARETAEQGQQLKDSRNYNENLHNSIRDIRDELKVIARSHQ